jgi:lipoprotein-releasing system permease protein
MNFPYQFFIAFRYLKSKKKHKGISVNTLISVGGVAVGVMALLVVLSVMSGFHEDDLRGAMPEYKNVLEAIKGEEHVVSAAPFVFGQTMVSLEKRAHGVFLRGIVPEEEIETTEILHLIKEGSIEDLEERDGIPGILIGKELSRSIGAYTGDIVNVISPVGEIGPLGMLPKVRKFRVAGVFEVGMFEFDLNLVLTDIKPAQEFFGMNGEISGIELKLDDIYKAPIVRESLKGKLAFPLMVKDWMQMNRNLFSALKLEKFAMFVALVLIILVASFNIISNLIMNVIEKKREIAILKAMGATNNGIMTIFMMQGLLIGIVGTVIGVIGGYLLSYIINAYEIIKLPADVYYLSHLPVKMKLFDFVVVSLSAMLISFIATIYPAWQAAKLDPVEPLRYE